MANLYQSSLFLLKSYITYIRCSCTDSSATKEKQFLFPPETRKTVKKLTYIISEKFDTLMTSFCAYVEDENVNIKKLKSGLKGKVRQPTIYEDDEIVTYKDINRTEDISDIILAIRSHCTFFNFKLLENLIKLIKYGDGEHMIEEYKKEFCEYAQRIVVSEIPQGIGVDSEDCECFCVELDESFKSCRAMYIDILKGDLCKILRIKEECLNIAIANDSCICIIFQVTVSIRNSFPLTEESIKALSSLDYENAKIVRVGYDGKVYYINTNNSEGKNKVLL